MRLCANAKHTIPTSVLTKYLTVQISTTCTLMLMSHVRHRNLNFPTAMGSIMSRDSRSYVRQKLESRRSKNGTLLPIRTADSYPAPTFTTIVQIPLYFTAQPCSASSARPPHLPPQAPQPPRPLHIRTLLRIPIVIPLTMLVPPWMKLALSHLGHHQHKAYQSVVP